ncbi:MAG: metallopeptidase family protein [Pseudomonadota bacterium]
MTKVETSKFGLAPSLDDFAEIAEAAVKSLAEPFQSLAAGVSVRVSDVADPETLEALFIEDPYELTGLYSGVALTLEQHSAPSTEPAIVFLYRMPILDEWAQRGDVRLDELIAHVVVHELGHHFGWSDEEMDAVLAGD